ncbi:MAG: metal-dependent transcriptional regulator [Acidobacteriota bacterium]
MPLTASKEDYIELIYRHQEMGGAGEMRITDLAGELACRLPTVTRTVQELTEDGYVQHEARGLVRLTEKGLLVARQLAHRHDDVLAFLEMILGVPQEQAESDACRIEHGLSAVTAERLHAFLNYIDALPREDRKHLREGVQRLVETKPAFVHITEIKVPGWRG